MSGIHDRPDYRRVGGGGRGVGGCGEGLWENKPCLGLWFSGGLVRRSAARQPLPHSCRRPSVGRECRTAAGDRTSDAGVGQTQTVEAAAWAGKSPSGAGGSESGARRCFPEAGRRFWRIGRGYSCAGRRLSCAGFSFSREVVPSPDQDFHFPARDGRSLVLSRGQAVWTARLCYGRTILWLMIFILLCGSEGRCARLPLPGPRFSFSCTGETVTRTGVAVPTQGWNPAKRLKINPLHTGRPPETAAKPSLTPHRRW